MMLRDITVGWETGQWHALPTLTMIALSDAICDKWTEAKETSWCKVFYDKDKSYPTQKAAKAACLAAGPKCKGFTTIQCDETKGLNKLCAYESTVQKTDQNKQCMYRTPKACLCK